MKIFAEDCLYRRAILVDISLNNFSGRLISGLSRHFSSLLAVGLQRIFAGGVIR